jgi:hypothetical protein
VVAYLRKGETYADVATGFGIGTTTVFRYLREALEVLADLALTPRISKREVSRICTHLDTEVGARRRRRPGWDGRRCIAEAGEIHRPPQYNKARYRAQFQPGPAPIAVVISGKYVVSGFCWRDCSEVRHSRGPGSCTAGRIQ